MKTLQRTCALLVALLVVWGVSILVGSAPRITVCDDKLDYLVPEPGSTVWRFTEGASVTHFGAHGFNPETWGRAQKAQHRIFLYGDSFIEAFQVPDGCKPDARLTDFLVAASNDVAVLGCGSSGLGLPSYIGRAGEMERVFGAPACHLFFIGTDLSNELYEDSGTDFRFDEEARRYVPVGARVSASRYRLLWLMNRLKLNFALAAFQKLTAVKKKWQGRFRSSTPKGSSGVSRNLEADLRQMLKAMRCTVKAPCVLVWCPRVPEIAGGSVSMKEMETESSRLLSRLAEEERILFINAGSALRELYQREGNPGRGFANSLGPGRGHLNELGIDAVFSFVAKELEKNYDLH